MGKLKLPFVILLCVGAITLPDRHYDGELPRLLVTFLGLVASSVLPTISLTIGSMSATGRSIKGINLLHRELANTIQKLVAIFLTSVVCFGSLIALALTSDLRFGEMVVFGFTTEGHSALRWALKGIFGLSLAMIVLRSAAIPSILLRALSIKHEIALDEAKRALNDAAPSDIDVRAAFATSEGFGRKVKVAAGSD